MVGNVQREREGGSEGGRQIDRERGRETREKCGWVVIRRWMKGGMGLNRPMKKKKKKKKMGEMRFLLHEIERYLLFLDVS